MQLVGEAEERQRAGHADGAAARDRLLESHGRAVGFQEVVGVGGDGGGLATVEGGEPALGSVPVQHEGTAADAGRLRLDEVEDELDSHRSIDR